MQSFLSCHPPSLCVSLSLSLSLSVSLAVSPVDQTDRSNSTIVYIDNVNREDTEGLYTCEVTTFPTFARTSASKRLTVVGQFFPRERVCLSPADAVFADKVLLPFPLFS